MPEWLLVCYGTLQSNRFWDTTLSLGSWLLEPCKLHPWRPEVHQLLSSAYTVLSHWLHVYSSGWYFSTIGIQILTIADKDEHHVSCNTTFLDTICWLSAFCLPLVGQASKYGRIAERTQSCCLLHVYQSQASQGGVGLCGALGLAGQGKKRVCLHPGMLLDQREWKRLVFYKCTQTEQLQTDNLHTLTKATV